MVDVVSRQAKNNEGDRIAVIQTNMTDVLVVEGDIALCRIVHRMLSAEQYKVQTSQSVADALAVIERNSFAVYLVDHRLPDGTGLEVEERIRSKWGSAPIILISVYDPSAIALRAEQLRISNFLQKPFSREALRDAVKKAVDSSPANPPVASHGTERPKSKSSFLQAALRAIKHWGSIKMTRPS